MAYMTIVPCALSIPFFLIAGLQHRNRKLKQQLSEDNTLIDTTLKLGKQKTTRLMDYFLNFNMEIENEGSYFEPIEFDKLKEDMTLNVKSVNSGELMLTDHSRSFTIT